MRPLKNRLIIKSNTDQKDTITYGTLTLYIPNRRLKNSNGREVNPSLCEVVSVNIDYPYIEPGDILVMGHNVILNEAWKISQENGVRYSSIPLDRWILGKLDGDGNIIPLCQNILAERIEEVQSSIIVTPDAYKKNHSNKVTVLAACPEASYTPGDVAIIHQYADYEIHWSINGEEKSAVMVYMRDIVGIQTAVTS